jgi:pyruvate/2-oxoglutarate dehydrogenase complex dihydrolipoamide acyltransferase (E2) component
LTHRPKHAETAKEPSPAEGSSSVFESSYTAPAEAKTESAKEPKPKIAAEQLKALSPLQETELPKVQKIASLTPKRRRMASVLDIVIESVKVSTPTAEGEALKKSSEATIAQTTAEAGPSIPAKAKSLEDAGEPLMLEKECCAEEFESPAPGASIKELEFIV